MKTNLRKTFRTASTDPKYKQHHGKTFEVIRQIPSETYDYDEVGDMYEIRVSTGEAIQAFCEEILDVEVIGYPKEGE